MEGPLVSVLMTVYNEQKYLSKSIESVLGQSYKNIQFIIINDGSTDKSEEVIFSFKDRRIEYYALDENRHIAFATNFGFSKVRGTYLAIMDSDDIWYPEKLERQIEYLKQHPEHKGCFTWIDIIDEEDNNINEKMKSLRDLYSPTMKTREDWLRFFFFYGNCLNNPSSLIYSDTISEVGMHNLFYIQAQDMEWWVRFAKKYSFGIIEEPLIKYRRVLKSEKNISGYSEIHDTRFFNEYMIIRYHFFDDMEDEFFIRVFGECFRNKNAQTHEELECEKAFLLCNAMNHSSVYSALGFIKLEELMGNSKTAKILKEHYHFSTKECGEYTGMHVYNDIYLQKAAEQAKGLKEWLYLSQTHIDKMNREIERLNEQLVLQERKQEEYHETEKCLKRTIQEKEEELSAMKVQVGELSDSLNTITSSHIWKMTKPFRMLKDKVRRND